MINRECDQLHIRMDSFFKIIVISFVSFSFDGSIIYYVDRFCPIYKIYTLL